VVQPRSGHAWGPGRKKWRGETTKREREGRDHGGREREGGRGEKRGETMVGRRGESMQRCSYVYLNFPLQKWTCASTAIFTKQASAAVLYTLITTEINFQF
jgi:hypothetical protein